MKNILLVTNVEGLESLSMISNIFSIFLFSSCHRYRKQRSRILVSSSSYSLFPLHFPSFSFLSYLRVDDGCRILLVLGLTHSSNISLRSNRRSNSGFLLIAAQATRACKVARSAVSSGEEDRKSSFYVLSNRNEKTTTSLHKNDFFVSPLIRIIPIFHLTTNTANVLPPPSLWVKHIALSDRKNKKTTSFMVFLDFSRTTLSPRLPFLSFFMYFFHTSFPSFRFFSAPLFLHSIFSYHFLVVPFFHLSFVTLILILSIVLFSPSLT